YRTGDVAFRADFARVEFVTAPYHRFQAVRRVSGADRDDAGRAVLAEEQRLWTLQNLDLFDIGRYRAADAALGYLHAVDVERDGLITEWILAGAGDTTDQNGP